MSDDGFVPDPQGFTPDAAQTARAAQTRTAPWQSPHPMITQALRGLPAGLGLVGSVLGTPFGPVGRAGLAGLGGATGQAISDAGNELMGAPVGNPVDAWKRQGQAALTQGGAQGLGESAFAGAAGVGKWLANSSMGRALASPQLPRYLAQNPNLAQDVLKRGLVVGGQGGAPAAEAQVASAMKDMPPLLQAAHLTGYRAVPENFRPDFEQQALKTFGNRSMNPDVINQMRQKFNAWAASAHPGQPMDAFAVQNMKQGLDQAAQRVYARNDAAEQGLFPKPSEAEMQDADFNKMMADIFRKHLEQIGGGKAGSIGAQIKAVNARAAPAIQASGAVSAAENAGVPRSQTIPMPGLGGFHGAGIKAGPMLSRVAQGVRDPRTRAMLQTASYGGGLPFGAAPPDQTNR